MICIKECDVTSTWAVLEVHSIIRNLLRWATRVHRPNISTQIGRWRLQGVALRDEDYFFENTVESVVIQRGAGLYTLIDSQRGAELLEEKEALEGEVVRLSEDNKTLVSQKTQLKESVETLEGVLRKLRERLKTSFSGDSVKVENATSGSERPQASREDRESHVDSDREETGYVK